MTTEPDVHSLESPDGGLPDGGCKDVKDALRAYERGEGKQSAAQKRYADETSVVRMGSLHGAVQAGKARRAAIVMQKDAEEK